MINRETLKKLINIYEDDKETLDVINSALSDFMEYWVSIYKAETYNMVYSYTSVDEDTHQKALMDMDKARTARHNIVLGSLKVLNRIAERSGLEPFYDGVISTERPERRIAANAVLAFTEEIIKERA